MTEELAPLANLESTGKTTACGQQRAISTHYTRAHVHTHSRTYRRTLNHPHVQLPYGTVSGKFRLKQLHISPCRIICGHRRRDVGNLVVRSSICFAHFHTVCDFKPKLRLQISSRHQPQPFYYPFCVVQKGHTVTKWAACQNATIAKVLSFCYTATGSNVPHTHPTTSHCPP